MRPWRVLAVGNTIIDTILRMEKVPTDGKVFVDSKQRFVGGQGANAARAMAQLGPPGAVQWWATVCSSGPRFRGREQLRESSAPMERLKKRTPRMAKRLRLSTEGSTDPSPPGPAPLSRP